MINSTMIRYWNTQITRCTAIRQLLRGQRSRLKVTVSFNGSTNYFEPTADATGRLQVSIMKGAAAEARTIIAGLEKEGIELGSSQRPSEDTLRRVESMELPA